MSNWRRRQQTATEIAGAADDLMWGTLSALATGEVPVDDDDRSAVPE